MAPPRKSQALAAVHQRHVATSAQPNPLLREPEHIEPITSSPARDEHDIRVGIVVGMGLDFLLGNVAERVMKAQRVKGAARRDLLDEAHRYLAQARSQAGGEA